MAKTITLPAELPAHPIFLSLHETHGPDGCWHLIRLLAWAATYKPDGDLRGMSSDMIEQAAGWPERNAMGKSFAAILHGAGALVGDLAAINALRISPDLLPKRSRSDGSTPPCPVQEIVEAYHDKLPMLAKVRALGSATQAAVRNAWKADPERQDLQWWMRYFDHVAKRCPFLIGRTGGERAFFADFAWLVGPKNMEKVINGRYDAS